MDFGQEDYTRVIRKGKTGWNLVYHQNWCFSEFHPPLNVGVFFWSFFLDLTFCMTKLRVLVLCFSYFTNNSIILRCFKTKNKNKNLSFLSPCLTDTNITKIFVLKLQRSNIVSLHKLGQVRMRGRRLVKKSNADPCVKSNSVRQKSVREKEELSMVFF